ncbi:MAG: permease [Acidobacteria bacterium]|nr:MAG: permease [Acidobacteriota bacterium]REK02554.1 MAG: permease [Acidobacteriota bacterium]REK13643.1 MAG: permease [Acidobacteriota bacterium]REK41637.1 MAG: permease [Acidobacteriota bacterium]
MNESAYVNEVRGLSAADALPEERAAFIRKTYIHLVGAILLFGGFVTGIFYTGNAIPLTQTMLGTQFSWLIVLGIFMGVSWLANSWGRSQTSPYMQYMGLILIALAYSIVFVPLLAVAAYYTADGPQLIGKAAVTTGGLFAGLSAVVFLTRKDFSFLGPILAIGGFVALGFIASAILFGFTLGNVFAFAMVAFAGGSILYETSNMLHHYRTNQHVAASMGLFASVALLFWYILSIFMSRD